MLLSILTGIRDMLYRVTIRTNPKREDGQSLEGGPGENRTDEDDDRVSDTFVIAVPQDLGRADGRKEGHGVCVNLIISSFTLASGFQRSLP